MSPANPMDPGAEYFRRLVRYGFTGHRIPDTRGGFGFGVLYFHRPDPINHVHDGLLVWQDGRAAAYRSREQVRAMVDAGGLLADPDPDSWLWLRTGDTVSMVNGLLSLPRQMNQPGTGRTSPPDGRR
jgi:hypothetical protein